MRISAKAFLIHDTHGLVYWVLMSCHGPTPHRQAATLLGLRPWGGFTWPRCLARLVARYIVGIISISNSPVFPFPAGEKGGCSVQHHGDSPVSAILSLSLTGPCHVSRSQASTEISISPSPSP